MLTAVQDRIEQVIFPIAQIKDIQGFLTLRDEKINLLVIDTFGRER
jgi:hypothetical protein